MYKTILVPLDGSQFAEHALPRAVAIAQTSGAALHLVRVHVPVVLGDAAPPATWDAEIRMREADYVAATARRLREEHAIRAGSELVDGPIVGALCECASTSGADLIVMTTHGRTGVRRAWVGSVADGLLRHSRLPVMMVRPDRGHRPAGLMPIRHVLVPLDGSADAEQIFDAIAPLGPVPAMRYTMLQVIAPAAVPTYVYATAGVPAPLEEIGVADQVVRAEGYLSGMAERLREAGAEVATEVHVQQNAASDIARYAGEHRVDLIAVTTHCRGASRLIVGSMVDQLLGIATAPLLMLRTFAT